MSKFELRDISEKLAASSNANTVISSLLKHLGSVRRDWIGALAFYECSSDRLVSLRALDGERLVGRDLDLAVGDLPVRLVRKFFHHALVAQNLGKRLVLNLISRGSPFYRADGLDRDALAPLVPIPDWQDCICFPLADSEDVFALLVLASRKRNAFPSKAIGEILPLTSVAAMALAQHLYRAEKGRLEEEVKSTGARVAAEYQGKLGRLSEERAELSATIEDQARQIGELLENLTHIDKDSSQYRDELQRVKTALFALEEQSSVATEHLTDAYAELSQTNFELTEAQTTMVFMRAVTDVLAQEHEPRDLPSVLLGWFCEYFGIDRYSVMLLEPRADTMYIAYARGFRDGVANRVRVRVGQGIAGWVAHNRKPLLVQSKGDGGVRHTGQDAYNSDSFLSVPLVHNDVLYGVINFSNKRDGSVFGQADLDRAAFLATFVAMSLESTAGWMRIASRF